MAAASNRTKIYRAAEAISMIQSSSAIVFPEDSVPTMTTMAPMPFHPCLQADPEAQGTQDLFKKVQSILNMLTPQTFNQLMNQQVMDFDNMCRCLDELKVPTTDDPNNPVSFIKLLQSRCKKEMDKHKEDSAASTDGDPLQVELQEAEGIARRRSVWNGKFIGELYKLKMLTTANIHYFVDKMLKNHNEESLECLCTLLTTIGRNFDKVVAKTDHYFHLMEEIVTEGKTSPRIRLMLQETIDLKSHNWVSRKLRCPHQNLDEFPMGSSPYIKDLMAAVCKAAEKGNKNCRVLKALRQKGVPLALETCDSGQQRQALTELKALTIALDRPTNLLLMFFHCMRDKDVKSGTSKDPANQLGPGMALKSVTAFFTWLR